MFKKDLVYKKKSEVNNSQSQFKTSAPMSIPNKSNDETTLRYVPKKTDSQNNSPQSILRSQDNGATSKPKSSHRLSFVEEEDKSKTSLAKVNRSKTMETIKPIDNFDKPATPAIIEVPTKNKFAESNRSKSFSNELSPMESSPGTATKITKSRSRSWNNEEKKSLSEKWKNSPKPDRFHGPFKDNADALLEQVEMHPDFQKFKEEYQEFQAKNQDDLIFLPDDVDTLGNVFIDKPNTKDNATYFFEETGFIKSVSANFLADFFASPENEKLLEDYILKRAAREQAKNPNQPLKPGSISPPTIAFHHIKIKNVEFITVSTSMNDDMAPIQEALNRHIEKINQGNPKKPFFLISGKTLNHSTFIAKIKSLLDSTNFTASVQTCQEKFSGSLFHKLWLEFGKLFTVEGAVNCDLFHFRKAINYGKLSQATPDKAEYHVVPNKIRGTVHFNNHDSYACRKPCCNRCRSDKAATMISAKCVQDLGEQNIGLSTSPIENSIYTASIRNHPIFKSKNAIPKETTKEDKKSVINNNFKPNQSFE